MRSAEGRVRSYELRTSTIDSLVSVLDPVEITDVDARQMAKVAVADRYRELGADSLAYTRAFDRSGDGFDRLARYERALSRTLSAYLGELRRAQGARRSDIGFVS